MPSGIINRFKKFYGTGDGERIYYATANSQKRDPESFRKLDESGKPMGMDTIPGSEEIDKLLEEIKATMEKEKMPNDITADPANPEEVPAAETPVDDVSAITDVPPVGGVVPVPPVAPLADLTSPIGAPGVVDTTKPFVAVINPVTNDVASVPPVGGVVPPIAPVIPPAIGAITAPIDGIPPVDPTAPPDAIEDEPILEKKDVLKGKLAGHSDDRADNAHMPKGKQIIKSRKDKEKGKKWDGKWESLEESTVYLERKSRENQIPVSRLKSYWSICVEQQTLKGDDKNKGNKSFWRGVVQRFNEMINLEELGEAKRVLTEKEKTRKYIGQLLEHLSKKNHEEAKKLMKPMLEAAFKSMINEKKVAYQKELGEKIAARLKQKYQ